MTERSIYPSNWPQKWAGKVWRVSDGWGARISLTEEALYRDFYCRSKNGTRPKSNGSRYEDRALQLLRRAGLIRYCRERREWEAISPSSAAVQS